MIWLFGEGKVAMGFDLANTVVDEPGECCPCPESAAQVMVIDGTSETTTLYTRCL